MRPDFKIHNINKKFEIFLLSSRILMSNMDMHISLSVCVSVCLYVCLYLSLFTIACENLGNKELNTGICQHTSFNKDIFRIHLDWFIFIELLTSSFLVNTTLSSFHQQ